MSSFSWCGVAREGEGGREGGRKGGKEEGGREGGRGEGGGGTKEVCMKPEGVKEGYGGLQQRAERREMYLHLLLLASHDS